MSNLYDLFYLDLGELVMHPGVVIRNLASVDVGPVHNVSGLFRMHGGRIENNAALYGAGIFNNMGDVVISGGSITGNAAKVGGAIYNQAVELFNGYIVGYAGKLDIRGGRIAENQAIEAAGGIYNMGAMEMSGGEVRGNAAGTGGGVLHLNGRYREGRESGMILRGNAVIADNTATVGSGLYYQNDANTWVTVQDGARVVPPNDLFMVTNISPVMLGGPLSFRGPVAQITPPVYSTQAYVLGTTEEGTSWVVSNYYGKFTVTPEPGGLLWHVGEDGRLSQVDPASLPAAVHELRAGDGGLELAVVPAYVAWDGGVDVATNIVNQSWAFQPLPTNAYSVTNGMVTVGLQAPLGVFRVRRQ